MARKTYVYRDGKLVEKHLAAPLEEKKAYYVMPDITPIKSPITGEVISSRPKLKQHMKQHEVTDYSDYSPEWRQKAEAERIKRLTCQTREDRQDRIERIKHALEKHNVR